MHRIIRLDGKCAALHDIPCGTERGKSLGSWPAGCAHGDKGVLIPGPQTFRTGNAGFGGHALGTLRMASTLHQPVLR